MNDSESIFLDGTKDVLQSIRYGASIRASSFSGGWNNADSEY
jgi:hypothetical protein